MVLVISASLLNHVLLDAGCKANVPKGSNTSFEACEKAGLYDIAIGCLCMIAELSCLLDKIF